MSNVGSQIDAPRLRDDRPPAADSYKWQPQLRPPAYVIAAGEERRSRSTPAYV